MTTPELDLVTKYGYERAEILNQASMADGLAEFELSGPLIAKLEKTSKPKQQMAIVDDFLDANEEVFGGELVHAMTDSYVADVRTLLTRAETAEGRIDAAEERARQAEEALAESEANAARMDQLLSKTLAQLEALKASIDENAKRANDLVDDVKQVDAEFRQTQHTFTDLGQTILTSGQELSALQEELRAFYEADAERSEEFDRIASQLDETISFILTRFEELGLLKELVGYNTVDEIFEDAGFEPVPSSEDVS